MMHPLHDYVAQFVAEKIKNRSVVVWYDPRREFAAFICEIRGGANSRGSVTPITVAGTQAHLAEYDGSYFELRMIIEPMVCFDTPGNVIVYITGMERDPRGSVLMELEKAGECYEPDLKRLARNFLLQRYTDGVIDEMLAPERITYEDLARVLKRATSEEPPSILKAIFREVSGNKTILAAWLARDTWDVDIETKEATRELVKLVRSRLGLELPQGANLVKLRAITLRYVLASEFRAGLRCPSTGVLDSVPSPKTNEDESAVQELARQLRATYPDEYMTLADHVENELGLRNAKIPVDAFSSADTFRFEERAILVHYSDLIATQRFGEALALLGTHEHNFWLDRDVNRKAQWEACRLMAELGAVTVEVNAAIAKAGSDPNEWIESYTKQDGWFRLDQAQRRLESWVATLEEEPEEHPLAVVRRAYEDVCYVMAEGFIKIVMKSNWTGISSLHQTGIFSEIVAERPKPVAFFLVDALRFEMGYELADRLPKAEEVSVRHAVGVLPGITSIGMAALLPGASSSFAVVEQNGKLGARIDDAFLPDLAARKKFIAARIPNLVDLSLNELLSLRPSKLIKKIEGARVVIVRSQEIDIAGETGSTFQARQVMDTVIDNIVRAIKKLSAAGIEHSVVTSDHGHLFFAFDRDESMRTESPGGDQVELHRRCWIGRGGATPLGCLRVSAASLGYESDLDFVFPMGCAVFKAGGDLAYHHGGTSLQELIIPIVTVRMKVPDAARPATSHVTLSGLPEAITNRIFSVTMQLEDHNLSMFSDTMVVRPLLMAAGRQVGAVGMAIDGELDKTTGCVKLQPGKPVTVAFLLSDESVPSLRVVVHDPATDAELYRSPIDIPIRLGV